jgi:hypothetical protein
VKVYKTAIRQGIDSGLPGHFRAPRIDARGVQHRIDFVRERNRLIGSIPSLPSLAEGIEALAPAFRAWPVSRRKRRSFVEEKQFGIKPGRHHNALPVFEFQNAGDPALPFALPNDHAPIVMDRPAAVAHHGSAGRRFDYCAERINTVLQRHGRPL